MLLEKYVRELLIKESKIKSKLHPKIKELVERFEEEVEFGNNLFFVVSNKFPTIEVTLSEKSLFGYYRNLGIVKFTSNVVLYDDDDRKICHKVSGRGPKTINSFWCSGSATSEGNKLNIGPLLYEIAMEYISYKYNCAIMPDIRHKMASEENQDAVSSDAYNVWTKYLERSQSGREITQYQFDLSKEEIDSYSKKYNLKNIEQVTDDDPDDDLNHLSLDLVKKRGQEIEGKNWSKSPLTKAFYKSQGSLTTYLLRNEIEGKVRIIER